jgi:hypothetical protein
VPPGAVWGRVSPGLLFADLDVPSGGRRTQSAAQAPPLRNHRSWTALQLEIAGNRSSPRLGSFWTTKDVAKPKHHCGPSLHAYM